MGVASSGPRRISAQASGNKLDMALLPLPALPLDEVEVIVDAAQVVGAMLGQEAAHHKGKVALTTHCRSWSSFKMQHQTKPRPRNTQVGRGLKSYCFRPKFGTSMGWAGGVLSGPHPPTAEPGRHEAAIPLCTVCAPSPPPPPRINPAQRRNLGVVVRGWRRRTPQVRSPGRHVG